MGRAVLGWCLVACVWGMSLLAESLPIRSLYHKVESVSLSEESLVHSLQAPLVLVDSVKVWAGEPRRALLPDVHYVLDLYAGTITFLTTNLPPPIIVEYDVLPLEIPSRHQRNLFGKEGTPAEGEAQGDVGPISLTVGEPVGEPELEVSGTKTFSVGLGSQRSLTPNQTLRLNVSGQVAPGVQVLAILSDQDLPFQDEGTTESIQNIDQKLVRVESDHFTATLGDFQAQLGEADVSFPRALQGVQVDLRSDWGELRLIPSAIPEGNSSSRSFEGIEGQNSYRVDVEGQYVVMKAGSETVWLNGQRMRRGEQNDYIVRDYGDPIIEFTSKHLITSHDVIRVDFEYLPEDLDYRQSLSGFSGRLLFPDGRGTLGIAYAVEGDDPSSAFVPLTDAERAALEADTRELDGRPLPVPERHSVLGFDGRYELYEGTQFTGRWALSSLDANRFSRADTVEQNRSWRFLLDSKAEWLQISGGWRHQDAQFVPVGATLANRDRFQYERQYTREQFDDPLQNTLLFGTESPTEDNYTFDLRLMPLPWMEIGGSAGRTVEDFEPESSLDDRQRENLSASVRLHPEGFPELRYDRYSNRTEVDDALAFEKLRQLTSVAYRIGGGKWSVFDERTLALDRNLTDSINANQHRQRRGTRIEWGASSSVRFSGEYSHEFSRVRDELFPVDGEAIGFGPWKRTEAARTGTAGLTLRPNRWLDLSSSFSRRVLMRKNGDNLRTNLADLQARLSPWQRSLDLRLRYEVDKKLETEKEEIFTNVLLGRELKPGEGTHVRLDEFHYQRDFENGDYVRLLRTVGDRPVASVETSLQLTLAPRRLGHYTGRRMAAQTEERTEAPPGRLARTDAFLRQALEASFRWDVVESQENAGNTDLYLLRKLQTSETVFGRQQRRFRLGFSPASWLRLEGSRSYQQSLDQRFDARVRRRSSLDREYSAELGITNEWSVTARRERRDSDEDLTDLGIAGNDPLLVSELSRAEDLLALSSRYRLQTRWLLEAELRRETEDATDPVVAEGATRTRTLAFVSRASYAWAGKGRVNVEYRLARGESTGGLAVARYNFYDGISHEIRSQLEYRTRQFTDLMWRFTYRARITEQEKPDHRVQMEVAAEL